MEHLDPTTTLRWGRPEASCTWRTPDTGQCWEPSARIPVVHSHQAVRMVCVQQAANWHVRWLPSNKWHFLLKILNASAEFTIALLLSMTAFLYCMNMHFSWLTLSFHLRPSPILNGYWTRAGLAITSKHICIRSGDHLFCGRKLLMRNYTKCSAITYAIPITQITYSW